MTVKSYLESTGVPIRQVVREVASVTGLGRPTSKAKPVVEDEPPGDVSQHPHEQIAVHRRLAEETGMYSIYCPWPGGGAPEYTMQNWRDGRVEMTPQQNLFVQGGWLFGFVASPQGELNIQPQRFVADGLGGGRPVQFYRIRWSPGEDARSVQCVLEQPAEVELAILYEGEGRVRLEVSGCGIQTEAVLGLADTVYLKSEDEPQSWYGVAGPCELTGSYIIYARETFEAVAKGQIAPVQAHLKLGTFTEVVIEVPTEDGPMSLEEQIAWEERSIEELEAHIERLKSKPAKQRTHLEEVLARLETICDDPDLHPQVLEQLDYQLWYTEGMMESLEDLSEIVAINETARDGALKRLEELRAQWAAESD